MLQDQHDRMLNIHSQCIWWAFIRRLLLIDNRDEANMSVCLEICPTVIKQLILVIHITLGDLVA